ncbi:MAG: flippase-like domain-containing protein [Acidimicrobiales bacterium]|nr:flippase-like domain-containing protein [Acidimicrobiales bacterium]
MAVTSSDREVLPVVDVLPDDDLVSGPMWSRHPADGARLVIALLVLGASLLLSLRHPTEVRSVSVDVAVLVGRLPKLVRGALIGLTQIGMVVAGGLLLVAIVRRPRRTMLTALLATGTAAVLMASLQGWLDEVVPGRVAAVNLQRAWLMGAAFPSGAFIAAFVAGAVVLGPTTSQGWRRVIWGTVAVAVLLRVVTAVAVPLNLAVTISLGFAVGSGVLAALGSPRRRASRRDVLIGLAESGFDAAEIHSVDVGASHSRMFVAATDQGRRGLVKLTGRDERDAYLVHRLLKTLRVKGLEDTRTSWSVDDLNRNEVLSALLARRRGVEGPDPIAVGTTVDGDGLIVFDPAPGRRLSEIPAELVTDELLDRIWVEVLRLRRIGLAHRWLTTTQILVEMDGVSDGWAWEQAEEGQRADAARNATRADRVTIVDFRWAVHQAEPELLAADVAMLVTSLALVVGADRAVAAAARALAPAELATALPLTQPLAMPVDVRESLEGHDDLLPAIRDHLSAASGDVHYELLDLERLKPGAILGVVGGVLLLYTLLSFAASWRLIASAIAQVPASAYPELIVLSFLPWVFSAGLTAAVVLTPLPFGQLCLVMMGQTFMNRFTPANTGGMALRIRYLQKRGVELGAAAAAVGITSVANGLAQVIVLVTFTVWAGSSTSGVGFQLPDADVFAITLVSVLVLAGIVWLTPWGRRYVADKAVTTLRQIWTSIRDLARRPGRFVVGMACITTSKFVSVVMFTECCRAIGIATAFPRLGLLYLTAATIASAAPTPGGVGAVEAALTAALTGVGVPAADALSAVFLFRVLTYWLPVPVSYLALRELRSTVLQ